MSVFTRELDVGLILQNIRERPAGAVAALFENWVPPGDRPRREGKLGLRLAVRNGYVNFYVSGQSVAKLTTSSGKLEIETHWKYQQGLHKGTARTQEGKLYPRFRGAELDRLTAQDVDRWARAAETYASAEKTFVERLVIVNKNVVDLEIALPGETAPRMDVAVVTGRDGRLAIDFWEAKCVDNGELRASTRHNPEMLDGGPKVIMQARAYSTWLSDDERRAQVQRAYQRTGQILTELTQSLVQFDGSRFWQLARLDPHIKRLATEVPEITQRPGLVVGAYCPKTWLLRRPNGDADIRKFSNALRSYRAGEDNHEERVKAHFPSYACFETGGMHKLPEHPH